MTNFRQGAVVATGGELVLKIDDLFKTVISIVETSFLSLLILLQFLSRGSLDRAPQAIAAARIMRRGEFVSGRTLLFFSSTMLVVSVGYSRLDRALSAATSALSSSDITGHALGGLILTAAVDLLTRASVGRRHDRARRLNLLRDGISCWLVSFSIVLLVVDVGLHGEYWTWGIIESVRPLLLPLMGVALVLALFSFYMFLPLVWQQRGRNPLPILPVFLAAPFCLFFAVMSGAAAWEIDMDDRGDPDLLVQTSCTRTSNKLLRVSVLLRNVGKEPLWVEDAGQYQIQTYVGGLQTARYAGHPIFGGQKDKLVTVSFDDDAQGIIEVGKTITMSGISDEAVTTPEESGKLWTCEYDGARVARLTDLPSRGYISVMPTNSSYNAENTEEDAQNNTNPSTGH